MKKRFILGFMMLTFFTSLFSQPLPQVSDPYHDIEKNPWLQDLRRAEILTLGSLPFTTMMVTLVYQVYRYGKNGFDSNYFPNPLAKTSAAANLNKDEQLGIFFSSLGLSAVVGVTDIVINVVKRNKAQKIKDNYLFDNNIEIKPLERIPEIKTSDDFFNPQEKEK
ncbi:MAG: hypothetical protein E7062_00045 [Spirochaetaceae bacterium]|nr:hypothetical protein [Spirochaetaceae bacterium]